MHILIVEDDSALLDLMTDILEGAGYNVKSYTSALEALKHYKSAKYSLIVTDLKMPGMSGKEFIRKIRHSDIYTPILVVSGYIYEPISNHEYHISKPFDKKLFLANVNRILESA